MLNETDNVVTCLTDKQITSLVQKIMEKIASQKKNKAISINLMRDLKDTLTDILNKQIER